MDEFDRIRNIQKTRDEVRQQTIDQAIASAKQLANAVRQELSFQVEIPESNLPSLSGSITLEKNIYTVWIDANQPVAHNDWGYEEASRYAVGFQALVGHLGDVLDQNVQNHRSILQKIPRDSNIPTSPTITASQATLLEEKSGKDRFPELAPHDEEFPDGAQHEVRYGSRVITEALECISCQTFWTPQEVFAMTHQGQGPIPSVCPRCQKIGTLLPCIKT